ncbi:unnamed protein product [Strongylus vulgaris]|uniref:Uncharacterized protein n=1 Tax=Strongylus vulgaris TaxID=40348 RepID=A0A3P7KEN0_STRVU|nr:unnamed protein product [Strongylus vulgaris]
MNGTIFVNAASTCKRFPMVQNALEGHFNRKPQNSECTASTSPSRSPFEGRASVDLVYQEKTDLIVPTKAHNEILSCTEDVEGTKKSKDDSSCYDVSPSSSSSSDPYTDDLLSCSPNYTKVAAASKLSTATSQCGELTQEESSILVSSNGLVFPEITNDVKHYLDYIRTATAVYCLKLGVQPKLEDILGDVKEKFSPEWIDYVLKYIPEVTLLPYDGQGFRVRVSKFVSVRFFPSCILSIDSCSVDKLQPASQFSIATIQLFLNAEL